MTKVVYNACYGGFSLSAEGRARYVELSGKPFDRWDTKRHDPFLVQVVEEMGGAADGDYAALAIVEIPAGSKYRIDEYDGNESVETPETYEWEVAPSDGECVPSGTELVQSGTDDEQTGR